MLFVVVIFVFFVVQIVTFVCLVVGNPRCTA
jgi:hypothetical protein